MSKQNVAVMKAAFEAAGREGLDAFIGFMADDLVHRAIVGAPDDHGPIDGPDEMKAYLGSGTRCSMTSRSCPRSSSTSAPTT